MKRALNIVLGATLLLGGLLAAGGIVAYATLGEDAAANPVAHFWSGFGQTAPAAQAADKVHATPAKLPSQPARLVIPAINVNAGVQYVGQAASGRMGVPSNYTDVGWYRQSPVPGASGTAIIDGHLDNGFGLSGVFRRLDELTVGDTIEVRRNDGQVLEFVVTATDSYEHDTAPESLYVNDGKTRLVLITCEGDWLPSEKTYTKRLAVFAELKS